MKRIHKYFLKITDEQTLSLGYSIILSVQNQNDKICLWLIENNDNRIPDSAIKFYIFGTGNPLPDFINDLDYIGTVQMGSMVWHVFVEHTLQIRIL